MAEPPENDAAQQYRLECEAREWLVRMERDPARIREKLAAIAKRRGQAAADELADQMRKEWKK